MTRTRDEVCARIEAIGIVPVIRAGSARIAQLATETLLQAGVDVVEITLTVPNAMAAIRELGTRFGDALLIGAGTVSSPVEARRAIDAGARFIVTPGFDAATVEAAHALDTLAIPGVLTPTEIMAATRTAAAWVKIFPCSVLGGPAYLRALRGPFPRLRMMPTGGVNLDNAGAYIDAGAVALGLGSELVNAAELEAGEAALLRERATELIAIVRSARANAGSSAKPGIVSKTLYRGA
jgi:2-dehydro-3-deoxyphosphogluconate aldolase/(4S)-4-hydroxy-2-oxoglutarate aldolase